MDRYYEEKLLEGYSEVFVIAYPLYIILHELTQMQCGLNGAPGRKAPGAPKRKPAPSDAGWQRGLIARIPNHPFYGWRR